MNSSKIASILMSNTVQQTEFKSNTTLYLNLKRTNDQMNRSSEGCTEHSHIEGMLIEITTSHTS